MDYLTLFFSKRPRELFIQHMLPDYLQVFAFKGQNMKLTVKMLLTCIAGASCEEVRYAN